MPHKYRKRQPQRPSKNLTDKEILVNATIRALYFEHHEFWLKRLTHLIAKNNESLGKAIHPREGAIHYAGKVWFRPWMEATEPDDFQISQVHPEHEKECIEITAELGELEVEQYEVERFMSGLLLFEAPVFEIKKALGAELIDEIERSEKVSFDSLGNSAGVLNNQTMALHVYVNQHQYIIDAMNERILGNMILQQSIRT